MGTGYLILRVHNVDDSLPIGNARVSLSGLDGKALYETVTDLNGDTEALELQAPDKALTLDENFKQPAYSEWNVKVEKEGYITSQIFHVQLIDSQIATLPIYMHPLVDMPDAPQTEDVNIPPMLTVLPPEAQSIPYQEDRARQTVPAPFAPANPHLVPVFEGDSDDPPVVREVFIPDFIRVHLGAPTNTSARCVRVAFIDYIKNVTPTKR